LCARSKTASFQNACFHHRDHIRLAWIYFHRYGEAEAAMRIAEAIRRFAVHAGKSEKYHETMTVAWMRLVAQAARSSVGDFEDFARRNPGLFDKSALSGFYSDALLKSDAARTGFLEPDLKKFE
jgi:hypothetical protein